MNTRQRLSTQILTILFAVTILIGTANALCSTGQKQALISVGTAAPKTGCIPEAYFVTGCLKYDSITFACTCDTGNTQVSVYGSNDACVLDVNLVVNCQLYLMTGTTTYSCAKCPVDAPILVDLTSPAKACAQNKLPKCKTYFKQNSKVTNTKSFKITCSDCQDGITQAISGFTYLQIPGDANSVACPSKAVSADCKTIALNKTSNDFDCTECTTTANFLIRYKDSTDCVDKSATAFYTDGCMIYSATACIQCLSSNDNFVDIKDSKKACLTNQSLIQGCKTYIYISSSTTYKCYFDDVNSVNGCDSSQYTSIKLSNADTTATCVKKNKFQIITDCDQYNDVTSSTTDLTCKTCSATATVTDAPYCRVDGSCASGYKSATLVKTTNSICFKKAGIAYCIQYKTVKNSDIDPTLTNDGLVTSCNKCADTYVLVSTGTVNLCAQKEITDCLVYKTDTSKCDKCKDGVPFDNKLGTCPKIASVKANCLQIVNINGYNRCIQCPVNYTISYSSNICIPSVPFCAFLLDSGVCLQCVYGYQLVDNSCVAKLPGCTIIKADGTCALCQAGTVVNALGACVAPVVCPIGQVNVNGVCQFAYIPNCYQYATDGKCVTCINFYTPSFDKYSCVSNVKVCPADTTTTKYILANGVCVITQLNCLQVNAQGLCFNCKIGSYLYNGQCYQYGA